ncbi:hypothetical protein ABIE65_004979 [Constrictibacter sp. MBR-5]|jgi:hypothetical protein|uniref:hypothetical protein n=1 Tax=Constrictibacter sp. MBR-5 TaxID=3156467 RepID=UPI00339A7FEE
MSAPVPEPMTCDLTALSEGELLDLADWLSDQSLDLLITDPEWQPMLDRFGAAEAEIKRRPSRTYRGIRRKIEMLVTGWPPIPDDPEFAAFNAAMADLHAVCEGEPAG